MLKNITCLCAFRGHSQATFTRRGRYCISSYNFRGNYLEIQRSQYIRPKVTVHKGAETIQGRKLHSLDSGINVGVRLLIFGLFSNGYVLIKGGTIINFFIF